MDDIWSKSSSVKTTQENKSSGLIELALAFVVGILTTKSFNTKLNIQNEEKWEIDRDDNNYIKSITIHRNVENV